MTITERVLAHFSVVLSPLLFLQGAWTRRRVPRLAQAGGDTHGLLRGASGRYGVLLLGESTVAGVGATSHERGLAGHTARSINALTGASVYWQVLAGNGMTARGLRNKLLRTSPTMKFDLVVVGLGANDVFRLRGPAGWSRQLRLLIATVREQYGFTPVLLSAIPPIGHFPGLPQPLRAILGLRATALDIASRALADKLSGVLHVPLNFDPQPELFASDGIHPSEATYRLWGRALAEAAAGRLPARD